MSNIHSYKDKKAVAFDLDGTLTPSKRPVEKEMAELFCRLLRSGDKKVAIMSGGMFLRFKTQFIDHLSCAEELFKNLYLFPLDGSAFYLYKGGSWQEIYAEPFSKKEKEKIGDALRKAEKEILGDMRHKVYGDVVEDRGSQITFSALGQDAPLTQKLRWDPDHEKRKRIANFLRSIIPEFDIKIGGTTSIDINKKDVNKAYAIRKMEEKSGIAIKDMLFVGDAIFKGGNDYQALETGVDHVRVRGPKETAKVIKELLGV